MGPIVASRVKKIEARDMGVQTEIQLGEKVWTTSLSVQHDAPELKPHVTKPDLVYEEVCGLSDGDQEENIEIIDERPMRRTASFSAAPGRMNADFGKASRANADRRATGWRLPIAARAGSSKPPG